MAELAEPLRRVLTETGYLGPDGCPAASTVALCGGREATRGTLNPDVRWRRDNTGIYFKYADNPAAEEVGTWQREIWNEGSVPLLWLTMPDRTELYNGFAFPKGPDAAAASRLHVFDHGDTSSSSTASAGMAELKALAGRLSMETGRFWEQEKRINRSNTVDRRLLDDLAALQDSLLAAGLGVDAAQGLIGRSVFAKYLADRQIISRRQFSQWGCKTLQQVLRDRETASTLFKWLVDRFNGDMFPATNKTPSVKHLAKLADFLDGVHLRTGQQSLFPYRFDLIPVELISTIYEQFVHSAANAEQKGKAKQAGVYYTPPALVSLMLDQIMSDVTGDETVLDITCGSGIFLVEALRRLVRAKAGAGKPTRAMIRKALYEQVHGVDISPAAIRVAAFSLYLAALELERDPVAARGMKFKPIIGRTLLVGDAHHTEVAPHVSLGSGREGCGFDLIVGNPPFTEDRDRSEMPVGPGAQPPRDRSLVFAERAWQFAHEGSRFGMVLKATPFFSRRDGRVAAQNFIGALGPATLMNLSSCSSWLFRSANAPVVALLAGHRKEQPAQHLQIIQAHWSPAGPRAHAFDITSGDVATLHTDSWKRNGDLFKAACFGSYDDMMLLERFHNTLQPLSSLLRSMSAKLNVGLILGRNGKPAPAFLRGMPVLSRLRPFAPEGELATFRASTADRPRERTIYNAPLLIVQEYMDSGDGAPRAVVANLARDTLFTNAFYGASLPKGKARAGHLLAGILGSSLATWYFLMAGSTFGIDKRRLLQEDVAAMPMPDLAAAGSALAEKVVALATSFVTGAPSKPSWRELDEAVFDLYDLDHEERQLVRDGVFRASWQWAPGRLAATAPVSWDELAEYAHAFLSAIEPWLPEDGSLRMCAEIHRTTAMHPLRTVRFFFKDDSQDATVDFVDAPRAGPFGTEDAAPQTLDGKRELDITPDGNIVVVKPSAHRHWLATSALAAVRTVLQRARFSTDADQGPQPRQSSAPVNEDIALRYNVAYRRDGGRSDDLAGWTSEDAWPEG